MDDLVTWLRAQLDEDERVARAAGTSPDQPCHWISQAFGEVGLAHAIRHDPARVLREVESKRAIVDICAKLLVPGLGSEWHRLAGLAQTPREKHNAEHVLRLLALPYADRPGYQEEWRP